MTNPMNGTVRYVLLSVAATMLSFHPSPLTVTPLHAMGYPALHHSVLPITLSTKGPTRITMKNFFITDALFYPHHVAKIVLHPTGFLMVIPHNLRKIPPLYLTVVGTLHAKNCIQDLKITFSSRKEADPVVIVSDPQVVPPISSIQNSCAPVSSEKNHPQNQPSTKKEKI